MELSRWLLFPCSELVCRRIANPCAVKIAIAVASIHLAVAFWSLPRAHHEGVIDRRRRWHRHPWSFSHRIGDKPVNMLSEQVGVKAPGRSHIGHLLAGKKASVPTGGACPVLRLQ